MTESKRRIPSKSLLEKGLPVEELFELAKREGNSKKPIYEIHKWWARRLGHVFRILLISATTSSRCGHKRVLRRFYEKNDLSGLRVLDPFMGGGTSVVEALKCGAEVVGVDIDPVACFVSRKQVEKFDRQAFDSAYKRISGRVRQTISTLYSTTDEVGVSREIVNAFWVCVFSCPSCNGVNHAHPHFRLAYNKKKHIQTVFCRHCESIQEIGYPQKWFKCRSCARTTSVEAGPVTKGVITCRKCGEASSITDLVKSGEPPAKHLFAVEYARTDESGKAIRCWKQATEADRQKIVDSERLFNEQRDHLTFPVSNIFGENRFDGRPLTHGYHRYDQLFNARQLLALSLIFREILAVEDVASREYLLVAFSDCLASNNQLVSYAFGYRKITPLFAIHGYQVPQRPVESNVWGNKHFGRGTFRRCVAKLVAGKRYGTEPFEYLYSGNAVRHVVTGETALTEVVSSTAALDENARACLMNADAADISTIPSKSVDLILTDPPFYNNLPYSELSDFYFQWLRLGILNGTWFQQNRTPMAESLLVRRKTPEEHTRYWKGLAAAFGQCRRIIKDEGMLVFTFHHKLPAAWQALALSLRDAAFKVTSVSPVRAEGVSGFHSYEGTPKWDAVICCRPAKRCDLRKNTDVYEFAAGVAELESYWSKRLRKRRLPWNSADAASLAFAFTLQRAVNQSLCTDVLTTVFEATSTVYRQKGVGARIPAFVDVPSTSVIAVATVQRTRLLS